MSEEKDIAKYAAVYTATRYLSFFFIGLSGFIVAKILGPTIFGIYSALMIIVNYSRFSDLGLFEALLKKYPFYIGSAKKQEAILTKNICFSFSMLSSFALAIVMVIASFFLKNYSETTINGLRLVALLVVVQQYFLLSTAIFRVRKEFVKVSIINVLYSVAKLIFIIILALKYELEGAIIATIIAYLVAIFYCIFRGKFGLSFALKPGKIVELFKFGFLPLLITVSWLIYTSIDKIMIILYLDSTQLGLYSIGALLLQLLFYMPQTLGFILYPYFLEKHGREKNITNLRVYFEKSSYVINVVMPFVIGFTILCVPFVLSYLLNQYRPAQNLIIILVITTFFSALTSITNIFLLTADKEKHTVKYQVFAIFVAIGLNYFFLTKGYGILGVSIATFLTFLIYGYLLTNISLDVLGYTLKQKIKYYLEAHYALIYALVIVWLLPLALTGKLGSDIVLLLVNLFIFSISALPFLYVLNKKIPIVKEVKNLFVKKETKLSN